MFIDALIEEIMQKDNPTVAGLDPRIEYVPAHIREKAFKEHGLNTKGAARAILEFNMKIIDAVYDIVPAVKPQMAYYEMLGIEGIQTLNETIRYAKSKGLLVILDGKRNDIGSTAEAYSAGYLGKYRFDDNTVEPIFNVDAITVNPYPGYDGIKPFYDDCKRFGKGIFILVKTSNKSSGQLQDILTRDEKSIYEVVAGYVQEWGRGLTGKYGYSSIGAVVGATYPNQAKILRNVMKNVYILVPGYGAQGGTAKDTVHSFNYDGLGAIVSASRSIMCAYQSDMWRGTYEEDRFDEACRAEAIRMRDEIKNAVREKLKKKI